MCGGLFYFCLYTVCGLVSVLFVCVRVCVCVCVCACVPALIRGMSFPRSPVSFISRGVTGSQGHRDDPFLYTVITQLHHHLITLVLLHHHTHTCTDVENKQCGLRSRVKRRVAVTAEQLFDEHSQISREADRGGACLDVKRSWPDRRRALSRGAVQKLG